MKYFHQVKVFNYDKDNGHDNLFVFTDKVNAFLRRHKIIDIQMSHKTESNWLGENSYISYVVKYEGYDKEIKDE